MKSCRFCHKPATNQIPLINGGKPVPKNQYITMVELIPICDDCLHDLQDTLVLKH